MIAPLGSRQLRDELFWKVLVPWSSRRRWSRLWRKYVASLIPNAGDDWPHEYTVIGVDEIGQWQGLQRHPVIEGQVAPRKLKA